MENNKYYTPDISDLFVGYECEIAPKQSKIQPRFKWMSYTIHEGIPFESHFRSGLIRTKFLTKEDIIREGFGITETPPILEGNIYFYSPNKLSGIYYTQFKRLDLSAMDENTIYSGKCPSINEFRKITKWLGI